MSEQMIALHALTPGQELVVDDPALWADPLREFAVPVTVVTPLRAVLTFFMQEEGCLVRGRLTGKVCMTCNRCAEDADIDLAVNIESFEHLPLSEGVEPSEDDAPDVDSTVISFVEGVPMFDVASFLWEEFVLALPAKPLCSTACKGLCPICGVNLNTQQCACGGPEGDPRLAALRSVVIHKKP